MPLYRHQFEGPRRVETGLAAVIKDLLVQKLEGGKEKGRSKAGSPYLSRRGSGSLGRHNEEVVSTSPGNTRYTSSITREYKVY